MWNYNNRNSWYLKVHPIAGSFRSYGERNR